MEEIRTPRLAMALYRTLLWLLAPLVHWRHFREGRRYRDADYARQRRGDGHPRFAAGCIWLHAASVGELQALLPLIRRLHGEHRALPLLVTTNTASSGTLARQKLPAGVAHAYLPMDWRRAMANFLAQVQPRLGIVMETELWPNLYQLCHCGGTPLVIINGRVSSKTMCAPRWLRRLYRDCLQRSALVLARSELDRERFLRLGAPPSHCRVIGNIKFASPGEAPLPPIDLGQAYVLAASTRDGEEQQLVQAWLQSRRRELLVIAPRHPQRLTEILQALKPFGLETAIRSRGETPSGSTRLYLADTFGELRRLMAGAELVFMGGSLVPKGGHNILEPAALGKAVVCGPYMDNFSDESHTLLQAQALLQVDSADELAATFSALLQDGQRRDELGQNARRVMTQHADMAERYLAALEEYL